MNGPPLPVTRRRWWVGRRWGLEAALLAPSLAAGLGLARLTNAPTSPKVVLPITACVIAGQLAAGAARRLGAVWALVVGALAVALVAMWCFEPSTTAWGVPTAATGRAAAHLFSSAVTVINGSSTPVDAIPAVVLPAALAAGLAAVCARTALGPAGASGRRAGSGSPGHPRVVLALAPGVALFCYASLLSSGADRTQAAATYVVAAVLFMLVADHSASAAPASAIPDSAIPASAIPASAAPASAIPDSAIPASASLDSTKVSSEGHRPATWVLGATCAVLATAGLVAVGPALASMHLSAFAAPTPAVRVAETGAPPMSSGGVDSLALVDDLGAVIAGGGRNVLFTARSDAPTYWQLTTLTTFDGEGWYPEPAILAATDGITPPPTSSLPSLSGPTGASTFDASVTLANLKGTLLPVPPDTVSARGRGATMVDGIGFYRPSGAVAGMAYGAEADQAVSSPSPRLRRLSGAALRPYLQLPPMPADVVALAHRIVGSAKDPRGRAVDLVRWFDDGRFRYSLTPPDSSADPLETFLFSSHIGFCQQFAGAYAALARIDGLPTRVAVGFDAGVSVGPGRYEVTGADAHVWPEVYLGPGSGWVSFEPTPPDPAAVDAVEASAVVYGSAAGGSHSGASPEPNGDSIGLARGKAAAAAQPASALATGAGANPLSSASPATNADAWRWIVIGGLVLAMLAGTFLGRRRLTALGDGLRGRALAPRREVVVRWRQAAHALERRHLGRRPQETLEEHARRVAGTLNGAGGCYRELVWLAERAGFSSEPLMKTDADRARSLSHQVRSHLRRHPVQRDGQQGPSPESVSAMAGPTGGGAVRWW